MPGYTVLLFDQADCEGSSTTTTGEPSYYPDGPWLSFRVLADIKESELSVPTVTLAGEEGDSQ